MSNRSKTTKKLNMSPMQFYYILVSFYILGRMFLVQSKVSKALYCFYIHKAYLRHFLSNSAAPCPENKIYYFFFKVFPNGETGRLELENYR